MTMMTNVEKVRENRMRRMALRRGLRVVKCRRVDRKALGFGCYRIVDAASRRIVAGGGKKHFHWSLDDVEKWLAE